MDFFNKWRGIGKQTRPGRRAALCSSMLFLCICVGTSACVGNDAIASASVVIYYGDINLSKPTGTRLLYLRLARAAEQICGPAPEARELNRTRVYTRCTTEAIDTAVKKIHPRIALAGAR